jgi:hypothetical protein
MDDLIRRTTWAHPPAPAWWASVPAAATGWGPAPTPRRSSSRVPVIATVVAGVVVAGALAVFALLATVVVLVLVALSQATWGC